MRRPDDDHPLARAERPAVDAESLPPYPPDAERALITQVDEALELISAGNSWYRHHRNRTARAWSGTQGQLLADAIRLLLPSSAPAGGIIGEILEQHPSAEAVPFVRAWRQPRLMRDRIQVTGTALRSRDESATEPDAVDAVARIEVEGNAPVTCIPIRTRLFTISPMAVSLVFDHTVVLPRLDPERPLLVRYGSITIPQPLMPSMGASRMEFDVEILSPVRPADGEAQPLGRSLHAMLPAGPARSGKSPAYLTDAEPA
jgi:hypothetical protein